MIGKSAIEKMSDLKITKITKITKTVIKKITKKIGRLLKLLRTLQSVGILLSNELFAKRRRWNPIENSLYPDLVLFL